MRILFVSDWQADYSNLDKCEAVVRQLVRICVREGCSTVVHAGDVKQSYDPVGVRVVNFGVWASQYFRAKNINFVVLMGNHDRTGMHSNADTWFPALESAGATVVTEPDSISLLAGDCRLFLLPFSSDSRAISLKAQEFARQARADLDVLVFHSELDMCRFNVQTRSKGAPLRIADLCPKNFLYCIGGHIHYQQQFRSHPSVWYVGSPFPHDWGEANQFKGYLLVDTQTKSIRRISSNMPRLYDPSLPGFKVPSSWKGHAVRIHVACDQSVPDVKQFIDRAKAKAEKRYPQASIVVVPEFVSTDKDHLDVRGTGDKALIESYVRKTVFPDLSGRSDEIVAYLLYKLLVVGQLIRSESSIELIRGEARNFLSFRKLELDYTHQGITLITGRNEDMPGASNGCIARGTLVDCPRDVSKYPNGIPVEDLVGQRPYVYSYDHSLGRVVLRQADWVGVTGKSVEVVRIVFKRPFGDLSLVKRKSYRPQSRIGPRLPRLTSLVLTADHLVMLRDGCFKRAKDLCRGDRLMPLYRKSKDGGYWSLNLNNGQSALEHRFVLSELYGFHDMSWHAHHRNADKSDNSVSNLQWLLKSVHLSRHSSLRPPVYKVHPRGFKGKQHSQVSKAKISVRMCELHKTKYFISAYRVGIRRRDERVRKRQFLSLQKFGLDKKSKLIALYQKAGASVRTLAKLFCVSEHWIEVALTYYKIDRCNNHVVKSVESAGLSDVYDLSVPGTNNFVANSVFVHNSGKSNLLALPSVALAGKTLKGQQHDAWSRQGLKDGAESWVKLEFKIAGGKRCTIFRGRRPKGLKLTIEGKDVSTGIGARGTQALLETVTGLTWEMLKNVVYIDQHEVTRILSGSDRERKDILVRFLNLERFTKAQDEVKAEVFALQKRYQELELEEHGLQAVIEETNKRLETVRGSISLRAIFRRKVVVLAIKEKRIELRLRKLNRKVIAATQAVKDKDYELQEARRLTSSVEDKYLDLRAKLRRLSGLKGKCPTCLQPVGSDVQRSKVELTVLLSKAEKAMTAVETDRDRLSKVFTEKRSEFANLTACYENLISVQRTVSSRLHKYEKELASVSATAKVESELKATIRSSQFKLGIMTKAIRQVEREKVFLEYCISVLSRSGLPAHLAYRFCPMLNAAAQQYSKMICGGMLSVKFVLEGTDIDVQVTNVQGGSGLLDQSQGETRLLGIVTGLALRQVLSPCNVLILDEPGHGLDSHNARVFGEAMSHVGSSLGHVMLTTHSPFIMSALEDCRQLVVAKSNRVSRIE